jgi:hypothetical protein
MCPVSELPRNDCVMSDEIVLLVRLSCLCARAFVCRTGTSISFPGFHSDMPHDSSARPTDPEAHKYRNN